MGRGLVFRSLFTTVVFLLLVQSEEGVSDISNDNFTDDKANCDTTTTATTITTTTVTTTTTTTTTNNNNNNNKTINDGI